jgi:hypothetical protein
VEWKIARGKWGGGQKVQRLGNPLNSVSSATQQESVIHTSGVYCQSSRIACSSRRSRGMQDRLLAASFACLAPSPFAHSSSSPLLLLTFLSFPSERMQLQEVAGRGLVSCCCSSLERRASERGERRQLEETRGLGKTKEAQFIEQSINVAVCYVVKVAV